MFEFDIFSGKRWLGILYTGIFLFLAGLLILIEPMILVSFIAFTLMGLGAGISWMAWRMHRSERRSRRIYIHW